ncbi:hypothetical protein [Mycobacterium sp. ITM-2016-00318]|uniref:hypothetical protein n=1 Tax=Mycobacterium sp. ITM-2016-00318 TaxID=2099693 RepID=UPI000CFA5BC8|nr:hypothetical protein [Mycobacterium sp. ITM-2016-00318]WNG91219.1 hypothetical protein C6A82_017135 [Mycobacterium sp. ITM-2016-00318]
MNANIARYIALPIVSAGILGGAALSLAGMAGAATTVHQNGPNVSIVTSPDTFAKPAPNAIPGWYHHHGIGRLAMFNQ